MYQMSEVKKC